jgi:small subunit ribosomal protein S20
MANIQSQKKTIRQDAKRTLINKSFKSAVKTAVKKALTTRDAKDISAAVKLIDAGVTKGIFHKNKAANMKSRVMSPAKVVAKVETVKVAKKVEAKVETVAKPELTREIKAMTVVALKAALTERGIEFKSTDKKADLMALLAKKA